MFADLRLSSPDSARPDRLFILLHGRLNTGREMEPVAQRLGLAFPDAMFLLPRGPLVCEDAPQAFEWFRGNGSDTFHPDTIDSAADRLVAYTRAACETYGLPGDRVTIVGYSEGMALAFYAGLTKELDLGAIVGFNGALLGLRGFDTNVINTPPAMIVHGDGDPHLPPTTLQSQKAFLGSVGVAVTGHLRQGVGHVVDVHGADGAAMYLSGLFSQGARPAERRASHDDRVAIPDAKTGFELAKSLKALIWDLDDTLWEGTLSEGEVRPLQARVAAVRALNASGLISAICSKNDWGVAQAELERLGLWDDFVFPRIAFVPKGPAVKALIDDLQLQPRHCLFLDDNPHNLEEATAAVPDLNVVNAASPQCDALLAEIVAAHSATTKSRVAEYRALAARVQTRDAFSGNREDFLKSCDLRISIVWRADLVDYCDRIEELINRTNQLNYLHTRVTPGSMAAFVSEPMRHEGFALLAWDKFGYHGLVGFMGVDVSSETILHMAFSCRIMHMGLEEHLLAKAIEQFPDLKAPMKIDVVPRRQPWISKRTTTTPKSERSFTLASGTP